MAYSCPRCGGTLQKDGQFSGGPFGLVGLLCAVGDFRCKNCGVIAKSEFQPEIGPRMTLISFIIVIALLTLASLVWIAVRK
jgi:hypothetical protein